MDNTRPTSVVIIDENDPQRAGLRSYFEAADDIIIVGEFGGISQAVEEAEWSEPAVVLLSISLPNVTLFEVCQQIFELAPAARIITLGSSPVNQREIVTSMIAGTAGHLPRNASPSDFVRTVRANGIGELLLTAEVAEFSLQFMKSIPGNVDLGSLTTREERVLVLVGDGLKNSEIAANLGISPHTVRKHISEVLRKLDVSRRSALGAYAAAVAAIVDTAA